MHTKTLNTRGFVTKGFLTLLAGAALLALSLQACTKSVPDAGDEARAVRPHAAVLAGGISDTKAGTYYIPDTQTAYLPAGTDFSLWAWTGTGTAGEPDFMKDTRVHNDGGTVEGSFSYSPLKYWPEDGTPVTFCASWPYGLEGLQATTTAQGLRYGYAVPAASAQQQDLLVTQPVTATLPENGKVTLTFRHALSRIRVNTQVDAAFAQHGLHAEITSVTLCGAAAGGTLDPGTYTWTAGAQTRDYAVTSTGTDSDILLLIPQATQGLRFRLDFNVHILDALGNSVSHTSNTAYTPLPDALTWEAGKAYDYTLRLKESHLEATVTVLPWELRENNYDYSTEITVNSDGRLLWDSDTYGSADHSSFTVITAFGRDLEGTFTISTPEGAVWYAILETLSGNPDAFRFEDEDGHLSASVHGSVGQAAHLKIHQTDDYPEQTNTARLSVVVRSAGHNIPVTTLVDNAGHNWTIVQNANN